MSVGQLVLCFASLEVEVDDLLWLANAQLDVVALGLKTIPHKNLDRIKALSLIAQTVGAEWDSDEIEKKYRIVQDLRNHLAHGRTTEFRFHRHRSAAFISRRPFPENIAGKKIRQSEQWIVNLDFMTETLGSISVLEIEIERLRSFLWQLGDGWPTVQITWEPKPFAAAVIAERKTECGEPDFHSRVFR